VFSGNPLSTELDVKSELDERESNRELNVYHSRIQALRAFSQKYFKTNNVPLVTKNSMKSSDFDMILRVTGCVPLNGSFKLSLTDSVNRYELIHREQIDNGIYKVRSIANLEWDEDGGILLGNDYTNFILVPDWMKSAKEKEWEKPRRPAGIKKRQGKSELKTKLKVDMPPRLMSLRELSLKCTINDIFRDTRTSCTCTLSGSRNCSSKI
jgi:hypothetical protein